LDQ
jgi:carnosine N-methyltransferase